MKDTSSCIDKKCLNSFKYLRGETRDELKIYKVAKAVSQIPGVEIRVGTNHPYIAMYKGLESCPIGKSTHVKRYVLPWINNIGDYNPLKSYADLKKGKWTQ
jgi:hypothetical protein